MSTIHIARNQQSLGSFSEAEVRESLRSGRFSAGDLAWRAGMPEWKPLGEMAPAWGMETPPPLEPSPADTRPAGAVRIEEMVSEPAWERREALGLFPAVTQTVSAVLLRTRETFSRLQLTGGLASPLLYFVLLSSVMFAISAFYQIAGTAANPTLFAPQLQHAPKTALYVGLIGSILIAPALYVVSAFFGSGITHLCLKLLGGAHRPFEATFRVVCYAQASAAVLNVIPLCGGLVGVIWGAYCVIIGLKEVHGTEGWRATLALVLPGLLCCGALALGATAAGLGIAEALKMGR